MEINYHIGRAVSSSQIAKDVYSVWVETDVAKDAKPGQYVSVILEQEYVTISKAINICEINDERTQIRTIYSISSDDSQVFAEYLTDGDFKLLGPMGHAFEIKDEDGPAFFIGGDLGIPQLLQLAKEFDGQKMAMLGFSGDEEYLREEFVNAGCEVHVTHRRHTGNVLGMLLENKMGANVIYASGPVPLINAVKQYSKMRKIRCHLLLDIWNGSY